MHDNCNSCGTDYDFDKEHDTLCLFIKNPECNHVLAVCPVCEATCRIFIIPEVVAQVLTLKLPLRVYCDTPDDVMNMVAELLGIEMAEEADTLYHESGTSYGLPEPPRDWLRDLYDDMREFGGES